jgi:hypothetical protein
MTAAPKTKDSVFQLVKKDPEVHELSVKRLAKKYGVAPSTMRDWMAEIIGTKTCTECGLNKLLTQFRIVRGRWRYGMCSECKDYKNMLYKRGRKYREIDKLINQVWR